MKEIKREKKVSKKTSFQITGKVETEEVGRPSELRVIAYVAGTKKQLGSTIPKADGTYKIEFEHDKPTDIDVSVGLDTNERVFERLPKARSFITKDAWKRVGSYSAKVDFIIPKTLYSVWKKICKEYIIFGWVVKGVPDPNNPNNYISLDPVPNATVHIIDVSWPQIYPVWEKPKYQEFEIGTATTDQNGLFLFDFDWCYTKIIPGQKDPIPVWLLKPDYKPDIIFKVTQTVNSIEVPIYTEDPSQAQWDLDNLSPLGVTLVVKGEVILPDDPMLAISGDFEFHGVGRVLISQINGEGYADTSGPGDVVYARDSPFGSTIDIKGQFNSAHQGEYYQVLYAKWENDATPPADTDFTPILNEAWPVAQKVAGKWVTVSKTPVDLPGIGGGCYEIPDYTDLYLTSKDILIRWTTHRKDLGAERYPDGKYSLMVKAFHANGTEIPLPAGGDTKLVVRIDNTWPIANIKEKLSIEGYSSLPICPATKPCDNPEVCGIVYIEPGKKIRITFDAHDNQNHFRNYNLTYRFGHDDEMNLPGGSKYFKGPPREDYGFDDETVDWDISGKDQCGYEVRLRVWDRTINGYHLIHWSEDFIHVILLEKP